MNGSSELAALTRRRDALAILREHDPSDDDLATAIKDANSEIERLKSPKPKRFMTWAQYEREMDEFAKVLAGHLKALQRRIDAMEAQQKEWRHCGTYDTQRGYFRGNHIVHHGSSFVCMTDCIGVEPAAGEESGGVWQMVSKRGRNGKDAGR